jgi:hypothetical protein
LSKEKETNQPGGQLHTQVSILSFEQQEAELPAPALPKSAEEEEEQEKPQSGEDEVKSQRR